MAQLLKLNAELAEGLNKGRTAFEMDGVHAGLTSTCNKTLHVIDKNGFLRLEADPLQNTAIDLSIRLTRLDFMRRKFPVEMTEQLEILFDVVEMKRVGVRDQIKRVMLLDPRQELVHPRILPEDVVPIVAEGRERNASAQGLASDLMELAGRDLPARVGLLEFRKKETLPYLFRGEPRRSRESPRGFFDVVIDEHIAEIKNDGFDFRISFFHKAGILTFSRRKAQGAKRKILKTDPGALR